MNRNIKAGTALIIILISIGITLRCILSGLGYTYDMQSYEIVAKIVNAGEVVYKNTTRYNYGPVWFIFLGLTYRLASLFPDPFLIFRFLITIFLTSVDICMWYILHRRYGQKVGLLFFLNPISIILTGYYSQFDNLAVLLGLSAMLLYEQSIARKSYRLFLFSLSILGISLMTKHIFFAFPLWLMMKEKILQKRLLILTVPLGIFALGFLPFIPFASKEILTNVFKYLSFQNAPLWMFLVPDYLKWIIRKEFLFAAALLFGVIIFRKKKPFEQILWYSVILIIFSYAIADQYFAIPLAFLATWWNPFFALFTGITTLFLSIMLMGGETFFNPPGWLLARWNFSFTPMVVCLLVGVLWALYRERWHRITAKHILVFLVGANTLVYGFLLFPSYREDMVIQPVKLAIMSGDYERANTLYGALEKNPPFAGSRLYEKLTPVRYAIEYYRQYKHLTAKIARGEKINDWKQVKRTFIAVPFTFPDKEGIYKLLARADLELHKEK